MALFTLEHGRVAYRADFWLYGLTVFALAAFLAVGCPPEGWLQALALVLAGLAGWTLAEYALHRFVLHGLEPFRSWHMEHHRRPTALIFTPTIFSATSIAALVFLPVCLFGGEWRACALTLGVAAGYLAYSATHHAIHHWRYDNAWLRARKRRHALHHHATQPVCFGVTCLLWDRAFGTAPT